MPTIAVGTDNGTDINLWYEDHGAGRPVVLVHGFPLNGRSWERQTTALLRAGHRVITYDRRGYGLSDQPTTGYDYDTFTADLHTLLEHLDVRDAVLVGHSMGTGEVIRYLATHGTGRVAKGVLIATIPPFLLKTDDNPEGLDGLVFEDAKASADRDRYAYLAQTLQDFYRPDLIGTDRSSPEAIQASYEVSTGSSAWATQACIDSWLTDFRPDVAKVAAQGVPMMLIHGTADLNTPFEATGARLPALLPGLEFIKVDGAPHLLPWTHPEVVNPALLRFCGQ